MFSFLRRLFSRKVQAEPINARRLAWLVASPEERAKGYAIGGRNYWKG